MIPRPIQKFIDIFSQLPSLGPRQAMRMAFYFLGLGAASIREIADAVRGLEQLQICPDCFFVSDPSAGSGQAACLFCSNAERRKDVLAVVERPTDILAIEKTKRFNGVYCVLGELKKTAVLNPDQKLKLQHIKARGPFSEIILAFDQTTYADFNASIIAKELAGSAKKITRLGRGIPTGGEIEFSDEDTLGGAFQNRS